MLFVSSVSPRASRMSFPCPACGDALCSLQQPSPPFTLSCGYTVCAPCFEAVMLSDAPACPVCTLAIASHVQNIALGTFIGELAAAEAPNACDGNTPPLPVHPAVVGKSDLNDTLYAYD